MLLHDVMEKSQVWMSHADTILELPEGFELLATTESIPIAAFKNRSQSDSIRLTNSRTRTTFLYMEYNFILKCIIVLKEKNTSQFFGEYLWLQPGLDTGSFYFRYC